MLMNLASDSHKFALMSARKIITNYTYQLLKYTLYGERRFGSSKGVLETTFTAVDAAPKRETNLAKGRYT